MSGEGESKKQSKLAWMEKLLIGVSLLLMVGFGAVLFGVPFLNDAVIRKAQKSVAKVLGVGPDPKLLQGGSSSTYGGGGWNGQLGEKCPMRTIAITLDVDTPLNRSVSELLAKKLTDSGRFDRVQFFDSKQTTTDDFDRWVSIHIDESDLPASLKRDKGFDGKPETEVEIKYFVIAEPTHQTLNQQEPLLADPLVNVDDGVEMKREFTYRGGISLDDLRPMLPEKLAEDIFNRLLSAQERHEKSFGELPHDLLTSFWPAETPVFTPTVLSDFAHRQIRSTHGFLTSKDSVWMVEVPSMELRDFYRRAQAEFISKGFAELSEYRHPIKLDEEVFKIPADCIAVSKSPEHNDCWEISPAPRPELIGVDYKVKQSALPAATTRLYVHYTRMLSKSEYKNLVDELSKTPDVTLEKVLMFRRELTSIDKTRFEDLLKRYDSPENDLLLSLVRFEAISKEMTEEDRITTWKQLFIRLLKEDPDEQYESMLSRTIDWQVKKNLYETFAADLRAAGIPEIVETPSITVKLRPGEFYSAILTDSTGKTSIAKTYVSRMPTGGIEVRQAIHSSSGYTSSSPSLLPDGKSQPINIGYNDFRIEGTVRISDPTTGEVEVELKKRKP